MYHVYTDGSCLPGKFGGWCFTYLDSEDGDREVTVSSSETNTTNNRMELQAVIEAIQWFNLWHETEPLTIYTDSTYVKQGITTWIQAWKRNGWKTSLKQPIKNQDLWKQLDSLYDPSYMTIQWVKGHENNPGNIRADKGANEESRALRDENVSS